MDGTVVVNAGLGQRLSVTVNDFTIENQFNLNVEAIAIEIIKWHTY